MEKYLSKETNESLLELIDYIKETREYKECIRLKNEMSKNTELLKLINEVKSCQRKYVLSNYSDDKKALLDEKMAVLNGNSLFAAYSYYLDKVNDMISVVKNELNDYFYNITNILM